MKTVSLFDAQKKKNEKVNPDLLKTTGGRKVIKEKNDNYKDIIYLLLIYTLEIRVGFFFF